jgi:hypothetical protein
MKTAMENRKVSAIRDRFVATYGHNQPFIPADLVRDGFKRKPSEAIEFLTRTKQTWFLDGNENRLKMQAGIWTIVKA